MLPLQRRVFMFFNSDKYEKLQKWDSNPRRTVDKNMLRFYSLCYVPVLTN